MNYEITKEDRAVIALCTQTKLTYKKIQLIIETLEDVSVIFSNFTNKDNDIKLSDKELKEINNIDVEVLDSFLLSLNKMNIEIFTIMSDIYPDNLKEIYNPPFVLYAKGDLGLLTSKNTLSIVGTRRATSYGDNVTRTFVKSLVKEDICIISGLADGIDTIAHEATLDNKGKTIAVMGSGFNNIYPASNTNLANRIIDNGGLILTEYEPNALPQSYHFPARNRIIAGLSQGVLIVEAPQRSGALITKEFALDCNREIFVVPGRITDIYSKGANEVIRSCQGSIVLSVQDILEFYGKIASNSAKPKEIQLSMEEELLYNLISASDMHYEQLLKESGLSSSELNTLLIKMELKNIIKKLPGNIYTNARI